MSYDNGDDLVFWEGIRTINDPTLSYPTSNNFPEILILTPIVLFVHNIQYDSIVEQ